MLDDLQSYNDVELSFKYATGKVIDIGDMETAFGDVSLGFCHSLGGDIDANDIIAEVGQRSCLIPRAAADVEDAGLI